MNLKNKMIAILVGPKFQDDEVIQPRRYFTELGADVKIIGIQKGPCSGKGQATVEVEALISQAHPNQFDGLIIPGGSAPEQLRLNKDVLAFVRDFMADAKPIAAICHGPQILISACLARGRTMTCYPGIRDDLINAGAKYLDQDVVVDHNLVTSRVHQDILAFNKTFAGLLGQFDSEKTPWAHATPPQVLEYAIFNEIKAMNLYDSLSKKSKDKLVKAKFKYLAETERGHRDTLIEIFEKITHGKKPNPCDLSTGSGEAQDSIDPDGDLMKVLRGAMGAEDSAYRLYEGIAEKATNKEARAIFTQLAEEELSHKRLLETEYALRSGREMPSSFEKEPWLPETLW